MPAFLLRRLPIALTFFTCLAFASFCGAQTTGSGIVGSGTSTGSGTGSGTDTGSGATTTTYGPTDTDLGGGTVTLVSAIFNGGTVSNGTIDASSDYTGTSGEVTAVLTGTASLTVTATESFTLSAANTFTGATTVTGNGKLVVGHSLALQNSSLQRISQIDFGNLTAATLGGLSGSGNGVLANGSAAAVALSVGNNNAATTYSGALSGAGSLTKIGSGTLTLGNDNTYTGGTTVSAGTLQLGNAGGSGSVAGDITNNAALIFNRSDDYTFNGVISGTGAVTNNGLIVRLGQAQTYTGETNVAHGFLVLPTTVDQGLSASTQVTVASGAYFDISNHATTLAGLTGAGTVYSFGGTAGHLTVATSETQTFSGTLGGGYANFALTKSGAGTLTLSGDLNNYTQGTTISAGTLLANNTSGSATGTGAVTVNSGGTLGGGGFIGGLTTFESGAHLAPGNSPGTLTFTGGLILDAGSILDFQLGTASDLIRVSGGILTGPSSGTVTLNLTDSGGFSAGTYTLFDYTGAAVDNFDAHDFTLGTTLPGYSYSFAVSGSALQLTATAIPEPATVGLGLGVVAFLSALTLRRRQLARRERCRA
ncbi:autotransporter-associated beta strand repeat-containing protein [Horticoccus luteus]|uniref:Autotransporter-associated beta strand repeat-containing protein n=1 Tax=Horticoccus luteus TaxID=2862869 RepID=A0A8F9TV56_9BACT|nr:autotransporter-associated beta strand repeat-containing protein [Horticoccus luteus]QYM79696.1 autotransporter-associated beta strand repeat-containing protein [Horticoccus luteus]